MSQAFFLTRRTSSLLEDFVHELAAGAGLFLLYGDPGVGKTRTLRELARTRLGERKVRWIDLKAGGSGDGALVDSSAMIENMFAEARAGDVIIADHFEMALKKTRHQLFLSWSTDGLDKHLSLIIAGSTGYYNELRQLARQYEVRAQSYQQVPLNPDETEDFLGFYLFPERPVGGLSVPPLLRNQIVMAQGNIGGIIDVAERAGDQISAAPMDDTESVRRVSPVLAGIVLALALASGAGWYYFTGATPQDPQAVAVEASTAEPETVSPLQGEVEGDVAPAASASATPQIVADNAVAAALLEAETTASMQQERPAEPPAVKALPQSTEPDVLSTEPGPFADGNATAVAALPPRGRLQQDLAASLQWLDRNERKVGTLQIMTLNEKNFDEAAFYEYVDALAASGIDISALRILPTLTAGEEVFSVVFGQYDSWNAAGGAKDNLPGILRRNSPIPRSVGGLLDEIRRLEGQN